MSLSFIDYELPLLNALIELGGSAKPKDIYPLIEKSMRKELDKNSLEYGTYKMGEIIWQNKIQWAREYLKRKGQLDGSVWGIWTITPQGIERAERARVTGIDPDEGLAKLQGVDTETDKYDLDPKIAFKQLDEIQIHETGDILGVRGIVYEPINEQGVILLFAALAYELDFRIEGIRIKFPDALLRRKNAKGRWISCRTEFEFKSSEFKNHGHDAKDCDLIICWEHDWKDCPLEVLSLKEISEKFK